MGRRLCTDTRTVRARLRETGVVFAVLIGVVILKERLSLAWLASIAKMIGTTVLKLRR